nr:TetR family transcriptional regulator C-terminal domain-containing protein [Auraticoccus cholistanensis]
MDVQARDRAVVEAAWRVVARDGVRALTVRAVAAEAGLAPSSLRYTFPTQASVRERAVAGVSERLDERLAALPGDLTGRAWARAALLELLPLDEQRRLEMDVFLALGASGHGEEDLRRLYDEVNDTIRAVCARAAAALHPDATEVEVQLLHAVVDGLALHLVQAGPSADPSWALRVLDHHLDLTSPTP